jgi:CheY-like chemotaxis protein
MDNSAAVLVVDDDVSTQRLLVAVIKRLGLEPKTANNGHEALSLIVGGAPAAMILDLLMPKMDGFEVLHVLKRTVPEVLTRTIVVTAAAGRMIDECAEIGEVARFLMKPLDIDELSDAVLRCVGSSAKKAGCDGAYDAPPQP